jgi:hypothetical protein
VAVHLADDFPWMGDPGIEPSDPLGVNEWRGGLWGSFAQLKEPCKSYQVGAGRIGCCTSRLYLHGLATRRW